MHFKFYLTHKIVFINKLYHFIVFFHSDFFKGLCEEAGLEKETEESLREYISGKNFFAAENLLSGEAIEEHYVEALLKVADMFGDIASLREFKNTIHNEKSKAAIERLERIYDVLKLYPTLVYDFFAGEDVFLSIFF